VAIVDSADGLLSLDHFLTLCSRRELSCAVALQIDQRGLYADEPRWRELVDRWTMVASRYAGWSQRLAYDLLDQPDAPDDLTPDALAALGAVKLSPAAARRVAAPGATGARAWNALAQRLTHSIRERDQRHALIVGANQRASVAAFAQLRPTRDEHTLYAYRFFAPGAFTCQEDDAGQAAGASRAVSYPGIVAGEMWDRNRLLQELEPAIEFRRAYGAPLYVTAFGASAAAPRASQLTWTRSLVALLRTHGIGWAYWTYRGDPFGLVCGDPRGGPSDQPCAGRPQFQNAPGVDYGLLSVLQSEA
jgi:hypothetical protein